MQGYNLMRRADRDRKRADDQDELVAIREGKWPRDIDDRMRWSTSDPSAVQAALEASIQYLDNIPDRIAAGELPGWES